MGVIEKEEWDPIATATEPTLPCSDPVTCDWLVGEECWIGRAMGHSSSSTVCLNWSLITSYDEGKLEAIGIASIETPLQTDKAEITNLVDHAMSLTSNQNSQFELEHEEGSRIPPIYLCALHSLWKGNFLSENWAS